MRLVHVVASALSLPALICGSTTMLASEVASTWLPSTAATDSLPLLYGTTSSLAPYSVVSMPSTKCGVLPTPAVLQCRPLPLLEAATNSFRSLYGELAGTMITDGARPIMATGTRSLSLYGTLRIMLLDTTPAELIRNV